MRLRACSVESSLRTRSASVMFTDLGLVRSTSCRFEMNANNFGISSPMKEKCVLWGSPALCGESLDGKSENAPGVFVELSDDFLAASIRDSNDMLSLLQHKGMGF